MLGILRQWFAGKVQEDDLDVWREKRRVRLGILTLEALALSPGVHRPCSKCGSFQRVVRYHNRYPLGGGEDIHSIAHEHLRHHCSCGYGWSTQTEDYF